MKCLFAIAVLAIFPACGPPNAPVAPPGMPLEYELRLNDPDQTLTRNLTTGPTLRQ